MKRKYTLNLLLIVIISILGINSVVAQFSVRKRYQSINGDMAVIGNNILSKDGAKFDENGSNDWANMQFINVDANHFSRNSSSADLVSAFFGDTPLSSSSCSKIVYAGLYWAAIYQQESYTDTNRYSDFNQIKFMVPGSSSPQSITADNIIYNDNYSYVCYKDVTNMISGLPSVMGTYTVGDMRASIGNRVASSYLYRGGASAGWMLVVIYENPSLPVKDITTFDGHTLVKDKVSADFDVSGYTTPNTDFKVKLTAATLEGDIGVPGDYLSIYRDSDGQEQKLGNPSSPPNNQNNFFDSSISVEHLYNSHRNPSSTNTLGVDIDYFTLDNPQYEWVKKGDTEAKFRAGSTGDNYELFFTAFNVETIAPRINLLKEIRNRDTNQNLSGAEVQFSTPLVYDISFQNIGNDDATNVYLTDKLPKNVNFINISLPTGVTPFTGAGYDSNGYNASTHTVKYKIADNLVKKGDIQSHTLQIEVKVVPDCSRLRDACSNDIKNECFIDYKGVKNNRAAVQYSYKSLDPCGYGVLDKTNFLVVDDSCKDYITVAPLCGNSVDLVAGSGFSSYSWVKSGTTAVIGTTQTLTVTEAMGEGTYIVTRGQTPSSLACKNALKEYFRVEYPNNTSLQNPLRDYATEIDICANDGKEYIQFNLCGTGDTKPLTLNKPGNDITWHKMTATPTTIVRPNTCPYFMDEGAWVNLQTNSDNSTYVVTDDGRYAVTIWDRTANCGQTYYFRVFKSDFDYTVNTRNIICTSPGKITVQNLPGYQYQIQPSGNPTVSSAWQSSNVFTVTTQGGYDVYVRQVLSNTSLQDNVCEYKHPVFIKNIDINNEVTLSSDSVKCKNGTGSIRVVVGDAVYMPIVVDIKKQGSTGSVANYTINNASDKDKTITGLLQGTYEVRITTNDGCDITKTKTVDKVPDLVVTSVAVEPSCENTYRMNVQVQGGTKLASNSYLYKIVGIHSTYQSYPGSGNAAHIDFEDPSFTSGSKVYTVEVIDANNCTTSKTVSVTYKQRPTFTLTKTDEYCSPNSGKIQFTVNNPENYALTYHIRKQLADGTYTDTNWQTQTNNLFTGLSAGEFEAKLGYTLGTSVCETNTQTIEITDDKGPISASAGVIKLGCDISGKARVRVANVQGGDPLGTPPTYYYSFDNFGSWTTTREALLAPGTHTVYVSDRNNTAMGCIFPMTVTIPDVPSSPVVSASVVGYDCEGKATISITNDQPTYSYEYEYPVGTKTTSNALKGLTPGTHTITVYYKSTDAPTPSVLLRQDFGVGPEGQCLDIVDPGAQIASTYQCVSLISAVNQYTITKGPGANPNTWGTPPTDASSVPNGRYLAIDIKTGAGNSIFEKQINDVIPNQPLRVQFANLNLYKSGGHTLPTIKVLITDMSNNQVAISDEIKVREGGVWTITSLNLDPQNNTQLIFKIISFNSASAGNDLAIDDILVYQDPEVCPQKKEISVTVAPGMEFSAGNETISHQKCAGANDGSYSLVLNNVGTSGYEYKLGSASWVSSTANPLVINNLNSGSYTLKIRKDNNNNCSFTKNFTINPATPVVLNMSTTDRVIPCDQTSIEVTASATGGAGGYEYALTQPNGTVVSQTTGLFSVSQAGTYTMTVRDLNGCVGSSAVRSFKVVNATPPTLTVDGSTNYCLSSSSPAKVVLTVNGGEAPYKYSMNGVVNNPSTKSTFEITNPGTYTFTVTDKYNCSDTKTVTIEPTIQLSAIKTKDITCDATPDDKAEIELSISGGYAPYTYQYQHNGTGGYQNIQVNTTATKVVYKTDQPGDYQFSVIDSKGCTFDLSSTIKLDSPTPPELSLNAVKVKCNGGTTTLSVTIDKGVPYYSLTIQGAAYSTTQTITTTGTTVFNNVPAGTYTATLKDAYNCEALTQSITIKEPDELKAFAGVSALVSCSPNNDQAEVRVANVQGGIPPYKYSFNNGIFTDTNTSTMAPTSGVVVVRDANECELSLNVSIPNKPVLPPAPTITNSDIHYNCDGTASVTLSVTVATTASFTYELALDGTSQSPVTNTTFSNIGVGNHTVTITYKEKDVQPIVFFKEDFGVGTDNESTPYMSNAYGYSPSGSLNDNFYRVTSSLSSLAGTWDNPIDGSGVVNGRFLAINVGNQAYIAGGVVYKREISDVDVNKDVEFEIKIYNLVRVGSNIALPKLKIQLEDTNGVVLSSKSTGYINEHTSTSDWVLYKTRFNPQGNDKLIVKIITDSGETNGNDVCIDDIKVYQFPKDCGYDVNIPFEVKPGKEFKASQWVEVQPISCHGDTNGAARVTVSDFLPSKGYDYSYDGTATQTTTASSVTITGLGVGVHTLTLQYIKKDGTRACELIRTLTLEQPDVLSATATITTKAMCSNGKKATIKVIGTGGTKKYKYKIDTGAFQNSNIFSNVSTGTHTITIEDARGCTTVTTITVEEPKEVKFTATPTLCYDGTNGQIEVNVLNGNGGYKVRLGLGSNISMGASTSHTFTGLAPRSYDVTVTDKFGCSSTTTVVIKPQLKIKSLDITEVNCKAGSITIHAIGGHPAYQYAVVSSGGTPTYGSASTATIANQGNYDIYVKDAKGCVVSRTETIAEAPALTYTLTTTDPRCSENNGDGGSIKVTITQGKGVYNIDLLDNSGVVIDNVVGSSSNSKLFNSLSDGIYKVVVTDFYGCIVTETATITAAPDLGTALIIDKLPTTCSGTVGYSEFGFIISSTLATSMKLQYSKDNGASWQSSNEFPGIQPGTTVHPAIRSVDVNGNVLCSKVLSPYKTKGLLAPGSITLSSSNPHCGTFTVTVTAQEGLAPYDFMISTEGVWHHNSTTTGSSTYEFGGLVPGRSYQFYVKDKNGCVSESEDLYSKFTPKITITTEVKPICKGAGNTGQVSVTVVRSDATYTQLDWELYKVDTTSGTTITPSLQTGNVSYLTDRASFSVNGIGVGTYFVKVVEKNASGTTTCEWGSKNFQITELTRIEVGNVTTTTIGCEVPGTIVLSGVTGSAGYGYQYEVSGANVNGTITSTNPIIEIPRSKLVTDTTDDMDVKIDILDVYGCSVYTETKIKISTKPELSVALDNCDDSFKITVTPYKKDSNVGITTSTASATDYTYSVDNTNYLDNEGKFTNVSAGTYTVTVKDKVTGCISREEVVTLYPKFEINAEVTKRIDCTSQPEAEITIDFVSGSGHYSIDYTDVDGNPGTVPASSISTPTTEIKAGAKIGTFIIKVTDNKNSSCPIVMSFDLAEKILPEFTATATAITCYSGTTDIVINEVDKGTGPYTYKLYDTNNSSYMTSTFDTTNKKFLSVPEGQYRIESTSQANSCTTSMTITLDAPNIIAVPSGAITVTQFACSSDNIMDEAVVVLDTASITGGTTPYAQFEFVYTPSVGSVETQLSANPVFKTTNKSGGTVSITVIDSNGCTNPVVATAVIKEFDEIKSASISVTQTKTCDVPEEIQINVVTTKGLSGLGDLEYSKDGGATWQSPSGAFTGLDIGIHNFLIRHKVTGCIYPISHQVKDPNTFRIKEPVVIDPVCKGGTGSVTFEIEPNGYDCTQGIKWEISGNELDGTPVSLNGTPSSCNGGGAQTMKAGTYTLTITLIGDPKCTQKIGFTVKEPTKSLTATTVLTPQTCRGSDAKVEFVNTDGGWGAYTYYVGTNATPSASDYKSDVIWKDLGNGTNTVTYYAFVKDRRGCEKQLSDINIGTPAPISATLTITQQNCSGNAEGRIQVRNVTGGAGTGYKYQLMKGSTLVGSPRTSNTFTNLPSGTYYVVVTDGWTCSVMVGPVHLYDMIPPNSIKHKVLKEITCTSPTGAEVEVLHIGGSNNIQYTIKSDDGSYNQTQTSTTFTSLNYVGGYKISVKDLDTGCSTLTASFKLEGTKPVSFTTQTTSPTCHGKSDGIIEVNLTGDTSQPPYVYRLIDGTTVQTKATGNKAIFSGLSAKTYTITVTSARSCTTTKTVVLGEPNALTISHTVVDFACNSSNTPQQAELIVNAAGGTPPYYYSTDGINYTIGANTASHTFYFNDNGSDKTVKYYVRDRFQCPQHGTAIIKSFPKLLDVKATRVTAATCNDPERIKVKVSGGGVQGFVVKELTTDVTKTITVGSSEANFDFSEPGSYVFEATSLKTGCKLSSVPYVIPNYRTIKVAAEQESPISCITDSNGKIKLKVTGYSGPYTYEVLDASGNSLSPAVSASANTSPDKVIDNLPAGTYKVRVTATNTPFCTATSTLVTINAPAKALTVSITQITDLTCDDNDATIRAEADGGWGDYEYRLYKNGIAVTAFTKTTVFTNLSDGNYAVEVKDKNGCMVRSNDSVAPLNIPTPSPIDAKFRVNPSLLNCHDSSDGTIEVYGVVGGSGNYRYTLINDTNGVTITTQLGVINSGIGSTTFVGLSEGTYRVEISDGWNCGSNLMGNVLNVNAPTQVIAEANIAKTPTCGSDAEITITASGGTPPYEYATSPSGAYQSTSIPFTASKDQTKTYVFYVKDVNGCPVTTNEVTVNKVEPITPSIDPVNSKLQIACHSDNTGLIVVNAIGGVGSYTYELDGTFVDALNPDNPTLPIINPTGEFSGLTAGDYIVKVTNPADGCTGIYEGTINTSIGQADPLVVQTATHTNVKCFGEKDGTITVKLTGGTGVIKYAISPKLQEFFTDTNQPEFRELKAGKYTVIARDENGCYKEFEFDVKEPDPVIVSVLSTTDELCYGAKDGTVTYKITGGTPPYIISTYDGGYLTVSPVITTATSVTGLLTNLEPTVNSALFVKDANGCDSGSYPLFTIKPGVDLQATVTVEYTCANNDIGQKITAQVVATEQANITKYVLDEGTASEVTQTSPVFTTAFKVGGNHTMTFYHKDGCIKTVSFGVIQQLPIHIKSVDKLDLLCANDKGGRIQVNVDNIGRPLTFSIQPDPNGEGENTSNVFENLPGGVYTVTVKDARYGCTTATTVKLIEPTPMVVSITHHKDESCYGDKDGELTFVITGGRPGYDFSLKLVTPSGEVEKFNSTALEGVPVMANNLVPGDYNLYYKDSGYGGDTCEGNLLGEIKIKRAPNLASSTIEVDYECPTASSTTITNKVRVYFSREDFEDWNITDLKYALNSINPADAVSFDGFNSNQEVYISNVTPGTGQFITLFFRGCNAIPMTRTFDVEPYTVLGIKDLTKSDEPNLIKVEGTGGKKEYTYYFNGKDFGRNNEYFVLRTDPIEVINGKELRKVTATVLDDLGCAVDLTIYKEFIDVEIPDVFTPNDDGNNDVWEPGVTQNYPNMETFIYDRYGRLIIKLKQGQSWDGTYNGNKLPTGDYWYLIYLNETEDDSRVFKGHFTLYR